MQNMQEKTARRLLRWSNLILWTASLIVPRRLRSEWLESRRANVVHWVHFLVESGRLNLATREELLGHCWGAFGEAFWSRFNRARVLSFLRSTPNSPGFCLASVFLLRWYRSRACICL